LISIGDIIVLIMRKKHRRILDAIFENPVRANIAWSDIETLLESLGAELSEGRGSRLRVALNDVKAVFHRPHPEPTTDKGAVKSVRNFLIEVGVTPENIDENDGLDNE
jgi:hypothetical protein